MRRLTGKVLTIVLILFITTAVYSQQRPITDQFSGTGYLGIGLSILNLSALQEQLRASSIIYPALSENMFQFGAGGLFTIRNWIISGEGAGLSTTGQSNDGYKSKLSGGYVKLETGYVMYRNKHWTVFPLIGIGGGVLEFRINKEINDQPFGEILDKPVTGTMLTSNNLFASAVLGADYQISVSSEDSDEGNIVIGLRAGYNVPIKVFDWKIAGTETTLTDGPETGLEGMFISIVVGISGANFEDED
ncbi:MAG TPA: hypothetical protein PLP19_07960 [bacterium]|nr:hypothetical protein [bacterium]HPN43406.1 hypothetical protein [bacterium]